MHTSTVCVVGLGYIGLPTAILCALAGHDVVGFDVNPRLIEALRQRTFPIWEPGLEERLAAALDSGKFVPSLHPAPADAFILCVPTPLNAENRADLSCVEAATRAILPYLKRGDLIVVESTVPPGCTDGLVADIVREAGFDPLEEVHLAHCPERVLPGNIVQELVQNSRCVGGVTPQAAERARMLYETFVQGAVLLTDARTAEMAKLMENTYRDINIAIANEFARICMRLGIHAGEAIQIANQHPRVNILRPGPGVGGHCLAVDPYFIVEQCPEEAALIATARAVNRGMPHCVLDMVQTAIGPPPGKIAALGLAYKANTDDIRESPAVEVVEALQHAGYETAVYDPMVCAPFPGLNRSLAACASDAKLLLLLTDHDAFRTLNLAALKTVMAEPVALDTRAFWPESLWEQEGFRFLALGDGKRWRSAEMHRSAKSGNAVQGGSVTCVVSAESISLPRSNKRKSERKQKTPD